MPLHGLLQEYLYHLYSYLRGTEKKEGINIIKLLLPRPPTSETPLPMWTEGTNLTRYQQRIYPTILCSSNHRLTGGGRAIAQAVSRRIPTAAARIQTRVRSSEIL
jgi:hypothetical protein